MDIKKLPADLRSKLQKLQNEVRHTLPQTIAVEAREHFVDNFRRGGFVNNGLRPWPEVKRRDPSSKWYGSEYHGDTRENSGKNKRLNYSPTATRRGISTSKRNYLMNSLQGMPGTGEAIITTAAPHAAIHNEGGGIWGYFRVQFGHTLDPSHLCAKHQAIAEFTPRSLFKTRSADR